MNTAPLLEREEYVEQAYFFRCLRERMSENLATQEVLERLHEEILSSTRLPFAIQFLATEIKHSGLLSSGFARLAHYFTPFQTFVVQKTEDDRLRFSADTALLILEREARFRAEKATPAGLFVFQFEIVCRNRLGYDRGLRAMASDPLYPQDWRDFVTLVRGSIDSVDFSDMVYLRSEWYLQEERRRDPTYEPPLPALFGEKEGKIAKSSRGRDPLFLFAALQRQLDYPEVPRGKPRDDLATQLEALQLKVEQMTQRMQLLEGEVRGQVDLSRFGRPELLRGDEDIP